MSEINVSIVRQTIAVSISNGTGGDMTKATYDPTSVADDIFDMDNMLAGTTNKIFTSTEQTKLTGIETAAEVNNISNTNATDLTDGGESTLHHHRADMLTIAAQGWDVDVLGTVGTSLLMDAASNSEFTATLPLTGTTTTISITNLPTEKNGWPVLHLITGATFDSPIWSGIDATGITLSASTTHNIGFQPVFTTSGWKIVAILMHSEADA